MDPKKIAKQITQAIKNDLMNRKRLRQGCIVCDQQTQEDIIATWNRIVELILVRSENEAKRTPWAVICPECGWSQLSRKEHWKYLFDPDFLVRNDCKWVCPKCGGPSRFDQDYYRNWLRREREEKMELV